MLRVVAAVAGDEGFRVGLTVTAFGFGFRHGIDWDHIAALTDITSSQEHRRRAMLFATLYAVGHALVVLILGLLAILLAARLPKGVDGVMEHVVGLTLVVLGVYVFYALVKHGREFRMRSRWMLIFAGLRRGARWFRSRRASAAIVVSHEHDHSPSELHVDEHDHDVVPAVVGRGRSTARQHRHGHRHIATMPDDPFMSYGRATALGVGMIHGIGAETPTQVLIFLTAAGAGGKGTGVVLLICFLMGLLTSNSLVALASTFGFLGATRNFRIYATVSAVTAVFSLVIGTIFLFGQSTLLPTIFGG
jgi:high-affinity nickel-transport protein